MPLRITSIIKYDLLSLNNIISIKIFELYTQLRVLIFLFFKSYAED